VLRVSIMTGLGRRASPSHRSGVRYDSGFGGPKPTRGSPLYSLLKLLTPEDEWLATQKLFSEGGHGYGELKASALEPRLLT
jgi:hypothetical protein